jgi:GGDEF domain-containing protein
MNGLDEFAEAYGFVARDDVVRAVALMLGHVVGESNDADALVGHLDDTNFCIVMTSGDAQDVQRIIETRLDEAMAFFYPRADWEARRTSNGAPMPELSVAMGVLEAAACSCDNLADLRQAILEVQRPH